MAQYDIVTTEFGYNAPLIINSLMPGAFNYNNANHGDLQTLAIGASNADASSTSVGKYSEGGIDAVSLGCNTKGHVTKSIAIGKGALTLVDDRNLSLSSQIGGIAFGYETKAYGNGISIGGCSLSYRGSIVIGNHIIGDEFKNQIKIISIDNSGDDISPDSVQDKIKRNDSKFIIAAADHNSITGITISDMGVTFYYLDLPDGFITFSFDEMQVLKGLALYLSQG